MNSSFSEFEKKSDEITATGGHRILSPVDVNDVLCPGVRVVKRIQMSGHSSVALERWAFFIFWGCSPEGCSGVFKGVFTKMNTGVFKGVQGVFTIRGVHSSLSCQGHLNRLEFGDVSKRLSYTAFHYGFYILPFFPLLYSQSVS